MVLGFIVRKLRDHNRKVCSLGMRGQGLRVQGLRRTEGCLSRAWGLERISVQVRV